MHVLMGVVADFLEQAAETVFDRAGSGRVPMSLDGRQVDHLLSEIEFGNLNALWKNLVQFQKRALKAINSPLQLRQGHKGQPIAIEHWQPQVVLGPFAGVGHHGLVLDGEDPLSLKTIL